MLASMLTDTKILRILALAIALGGGSVALAAVAPVKLDPKLGNASCLTCHETGKNKIEVAGKEGEKRPLAPVDMGKYGKGVHARMNCVACHTDIVDAKEKHEKAANAAPPDCATCHVKLWDEAKLNNQAEEEERLGAVAKNVDAYKNSFHARPDRDDPSRAKAVCRECHGTHDFAVPEADTPERKQWRLTIPNTCGAKCHEEQLEDYTTSVHGKLIVDKKDPKGAVCIDCHTSHQIVGASSDPFKLKNVEACGGCHKEELHSYRDTYHGQVNKLGYTYTAKCSNCHGNHGIQGPDDPASSVNAKNLLKTCQKCHNEKKKGMVTATAGYVTFGPHANGHDFKKYPQMWIATKFMVALLVGVFLFFWLHCSFWFYREWQDAKAGKMVPLVRTDAIDMQEKHILRFSWGWRLAHFVFALAVMTLVMTGIPVLFSYSSWGPTMTAAFGSPKILGLIHRVAASVMLGIFLIHFVYVMQGLLRDKNFRWFGPDSLIPNWKDLADCIAMFKWFVDKGPRPQFERWTYYEKFDYWAVFWGVAVIGGSGLALSFPAVTATYLPGWVLNVATLVHGEEAFLAAVFLFTVHFFNNHFRPDKLPPPDVVMFTGTQSLAEFRHAHGAQYQRMLESGELEKYLVDAPSRPLHVGSVIVGLTLLLFGLCLLVLIGMAFFRV